MIKYTNCIVIYQLEGHVQCEGLKILPCLFSVLKFKRNLFVFQSLEFNLVKHYVVGQLSVASVVICVCSLGL